jgi:hypothetical protein
MGATLIRAAIRDRFQGDSVSNVNIRRVVDNIRSGTNVYTPVIEVIVNAIQAIRAVKQTGGLVTVRILRSGQGELDGSLPEIDGFSVADDGIGFDEHNRSAFDELYTDWKKDEGGKGFGRFTCLKYFNTLTVDSVFRDGAKFRRRRFKMGLDRDIIVDEEISETEKSATESLVTISGIKKTKLHEKSLDIIARILVERILPYLIDPSFSSPRIVITDQHSGASRVLNDYLSADDRQIIELTDKPAMFTLSAREVDETFSVRVFKLYAAKTAKSKVSLVAHRREVTEATLQDYIPEFESEFYDKGEPGTDAPDRNYIIKAYVFSPYLDGHVTLERGTFDFAKDDDLLYGISQTQIEAEAAGIAEGIVGHDISLRKEHKGERIRTYVETKAPWHRALSREVDFSSLPMNPTDAQIEAYLQASKFKIETKARAAVREILDSGDPKTLSEKTADAVALIAQTNKNDLIHYVTLRKHILDLFAKALEKDENGKYKSEGAVHDIIVPRKSDTDELDYAQHNLWMLDERLNFAAYAASERPIRKRSQSDRTDITIYNRPVMFRGDNEPSNPVTIFEFKRPGRDDFVNPSSDEDPIEQIKRYAIQIRAGKCTLPNGRIIRVTNNTPFYGYVVCDLTSKVRNWLDSDKDFTEMPDGLGWFHWFRNIRLYTEVLSFDKVLADATMRNRVFFHKLGI